jgi:hypothetical protein
MAKWIVGRDFRIRRYKVRCVALRADWRWRPYLSQAPMSSLAELHWGSVVVMFGRRPEIVADPISGRRHNWD